jgi:hypothetical protein
VPDAPQRPPADRGRPTSKCCPGTGSPLSLGPRNLPAPRPASGQSGPAGADVLEEQAPAAACYSRRREARKRYSHSGRATRCLCCGWRMRRRERRAREAEARMKERRCARRRAAMDESEGERRGPADGAERAAWALKTGGGAERGARRSGGGRSRQRTAPGHGAGAAPVPSLHLCCRGSALSRLLSLSLPHPLQTQLRA